MCIKERCLSVYLCCLSVCSDLEPKLLDGFQPNLAWATPWALEVTSKNCFGLTHFIFLRENLSTFNGPSGARPVNGLAIQGFIHKGREAARTQPVKVYLF